MAENNHHRQQPNGLTASTLMSSLIALLELLFLSQGVTLLGISAPLQMLAATYDANLEMLLWDFGWTDLHPDLSRERKHRRACVSDYWDCFPKEIWTCDSPA